MNIIDVNKKPALDDLLDQVLNKSIHPQDNFEIAALIESLGWNDIRAAKAFGVADVFELSMILWNMIKENISFQGFIEEKNESFFTQTIEMTKSFLRGMIFALPMAISVISMLTLRFSLWSYKYLTTDKATSIAFGTILSFMSIGGFTQAIARRGFFYISQGYYNMAKRITYALVKLGYIFCIFIALAYIVINWIFPIFDMGMLTLTIIFYLFLSSNWLAVTVMYILRREFTFTALITAGIGVVYVLFKVFKLDIILSQIVALIFISILGLVLIVYFFNIEERKMEKGIAPTMAKKSITLYSLAPYFKYGLVYFTFLFMDRIISWSTDGAYMPYFIWFRGDYELGLDFALLMLIIPMGFNEVAVTRLMESFEIIQKNSIGYDTENINRKNFKHYITSISLVAIVAVISTITIYIGVVYLNNHNFLGYDDLVLSSITLLVFKAALAAYLILCIALTNSVILFAFSQPEMVTKVMYLSTGVNFITGFVLSRWFGHEYAVFGLLAGSVMFVVLTTKNILKVVLNVDYYLYSSL
jgi:hypothetical protein